MKQSKLLPVAVMLLALVSASPAYGPGGPDVGQAAPNFTAVDQDGKKFSLSDYRGKVVVLDFWGFW